MAVKYKKSQIFILSIIAAMLSATPFLSTSIRSAYYYFFVNLLIVALGAEAGLLSSSLLKPAPSMEENKKIVSASSSLDLKTKIVSSSSSKDHYSMRKLTPVSTSASTDYSWVSADLQGGCNTTSIITRHEQTTTNSENCGSTMDNTVKKFATANICIDENICKVIKKQCPSQQSIFFIESEDSMCEEEGRKEEEEEDIVGGISEEELYAKAEAFIGNFYKQLKMQRQESWNRIQNALQQH